MPSNPTPADRKRATRLRAKWDARKDRAVTQAVAAKRLGCHQTAVSHYLTGRVPLTPEVVKGFAAILGLDPATIEPSWDYSERLPAALTPEGYAVALQWQNLPEALRDDFRRLLVTMGGRESYADFVDGVAKKGVKT